MKRVILEGVSKKFRIGFKKNVGALSRIVLLFSGKEPKKTFWALTDISFSADSGEIIGIIGENGAYLALVAKRNEPDMEKFEQEKENLV